LVVVVQLLLHLPLHTPTIWELQLRVEETTTLWLHLQEQEEED
jgi:hypothetical protein